MHCVVHDYISIITQYYIITSAKSHVVIFSLEIFLAGRTQYRFDQWQFLGMKVIQDCLT